MNDAASKTVLITGATGGVGRALVRAFQDQGYSVAIISRREVSDLTNVSTIICDLSSTEYIAEAVAQAQLALGRIDVCVHAAASPIVRERLVDMSEKQFMGEFELNVFAAFALFRAVARIMTEQGSGVLIGIESTVLTKSGARMGGYTAAKFALRGFLRELSRELSPTGISVYAVAPGLMRTTLTSDLPDRYLEVAEAAQGHPLETPEQTAAAVLALVQEGAPTGTMRTVATGTDSLL